VDRSLCLCGEPMHADHHEGTKVQAPVGRAPVRAGPAALGDRGAGGALAWGKGSRENANLRQSFFAASGEISFSR
jgi:hypothetical protein